MGAPQRWAVWRSARDRARSARWWWGPSASCSFVAAASPHGATVGALGLPSSAGGSQAPALGVFDLQELLETVDQLLEAMGGKQASSWIVPCLDPQSSMDRWATGRSGLQRALSAGASAAGFVGGAVVAALGGGAAPPVAQAGALMANKLAEASAARLATAEGSAIFKDARKAALLAGFDTVGRARVVERLRLPVIVSQDGSRSPAWGWAVNTIMRAAWSNGPALRLSHWSLTLPARTLASLVIAPGAWLCVEARAREEILDRTAVWERQERSASALWQLFREGEGAGDHVQELIAHLSSGTRTRRGGPYRA